MTTTTNPRQQFDDETQNEFMKKIHNMLVVNTNNPPYQVTADNLLIAEMKTIKQNELEALKKYSKEDYDALMEKFKKFITIGLPPVDFAILVQSPIYHEYDEMKNPKSIDNEYDEMKNPKSIDNYHYPLLHKLESNGFGDTLKILDNAACDAFQQIKNLEGDESTKNDVLKKNDVLELWEDLAYILSHISRKSLNNWLKGEKLELIEEPINKRDRRITNLTDSASANYKEKILSIYALKNISALINSSRAVMAINKEWRNLTANVDIDLVRKAMDLAKTGIAAYGTDKEKNFIKGKNSDYYFEKYMGYPYPSKPQNQSFSEKLKQ